MSYRSMSNTASSGTTSGVFIVVAAVALWPAVVLDGNETRVGDGEGNCGRWGMDGEAPDSLGRDDSGASGGGSSASVMQSHFRLRGRAAVTSGGWRLHEQDRPGGCGHWRNGRPGLRTAMRTRSWPWLQTEVLCPRMHGSLRRRRGQKMACSVIAHSWMILCLLTKPF